MIVQHRPLEIKLFTCSQALGMLRQRVFGIYQVWYRVSGILVGQEGSTKRQKTKITTWRIVNNALDRSSATRRTRRDATDNSDAVHEDLRVASGSRYITIKHNSPHGSKTKQNETKQKKAERNGEVIRKHKSSAS